MKRIIITILLLAVFIASLSGQKFRHLEDYSGLTAVTPANGIEDTELMSEWSNISQINSRGTSFLFKVTA